MKTYVLLHFEHKIKDVIVLQAACRPQTWHTYRQGSAELGAKNTLPQTENPKMLSESKTL